MNSRKVDDLVRELNKIQNLLKELGVSEEVLEKEVKTFGNGGHVVLPKEHISKKVRIIVG